MYMNICEVKKMNYDFDLSIYVATYNHEKYITKALDSIFMQKTQYSFEVLVGEDCSTDNTRLVLKEYEKKNHNNLTIYYRQQNMSTMDISNAMDLILKCRGKYLIALEGDDYWIDESKIEKQISFLESHPDYLAVSHKCLVVDKNGIENGERYPECKKNQYKYRHFLFDTYPGQLTTVMYRNYRSFDLGIDRSLILNCKGLGPGDRATYFTLLLNGKIYCMKDVMSAYRHVTNEGSSYSATYKYDYRKSIEYQYQFVLYARKMKDKKAEMIAETLFYASVYHAYTNKKLNHNDYQKCIDKIKHPIMTKILYVIRGMVRRIS